jgi:heterodisulfide reductase subunit A
MPEEKEGEVRIGVFICHCGTNIGGFVDVPAVVEYAKTLPNVVYAEGNLYTCADDGLTAITNGIKEHNLNRVVVASCTPRTHAPLFMSTCEKAGVNPYLFDFANIRDQCSWVHMKIQDEATQKAKDLVRMSVAKAAKLRPLEGIRIPVEQTALVIGGGISGMTAASTLGKQGYKVHLLEKTNELGGMLNQLNVVFPAKEKPEEILGPLKKYVTSSDKITVHMNTMVDDIMGYVGNYDVTIKKVETEEKEKFKVGVIIVATGALEFKPKGFFGYGIHDGVITQLELEKKLKEETDELKKIKSVVMIQCAGARTEAEGGKTYCARICCVEAIKNATLLKELNPDIDVVILHRDIQTYGIDYEEAYDNAKKTGVVFMRYSPKKLPTVFRNEAEGLLDVELEDELYGGKVGIMADTVVLSAPMEQQVGQKALAQNLKVPLGQDGFFFEAHVKLRPIDFATDGIFLCGTAHGPKDISESVNQALGTVARAVGLLRPASVIAEPITADVDHTKCRGCGICVQVCPYGAMKLVETEDGPRAENIPAACKGCGCCGASCPHKAIIMNNYTDEQLLAQTYKALEEVLSNGG